MISEFLSGLCKLFFPTFCCYYVLDRNRVQASMKMNNMFSVVPNSLAYIFSIVSHIQSTGLSTRLFV